MDDFKSLDDAALKQMLENASSYDERSAIRKEMRERKKKSGGQPGTRGTSTYSRFAGGRTVADTKSKSYIPSVTSSPGSGTKPTNRVASPSPLNTPPVAPSPEPKEELTQDEIRHQEEERKRQDDIEQELERQERVREEKELEKEAELKLEHEREKERQRQEEARAKELKRKQEEEEEERLESLKRNQEEEEEERLESLKRKQEEEEEERLESLKRNQEEEEERLELLKRNQEEEEERLESLKRKQEEEEMRKIEERKLYEEMKKQEEQEQNEISNSQLEDEVEDSCPSTNDKDEADLGTSPFGVQLKSRGSTKLTNATPTPKKTPGDSSPEFSKLKLNKTVSSEKQTKTESNKSQGFGVTLKTHVGSISTSSARERSSSYNTTPTTKGSGMGGAPKTLADFQKLANRSRSNTSPAPHSGKTLSESSLQSKLVDYVNASLELRPPISRTGTALYNTCKRPSVLCRLINKSVRGTVDLRALTKTPPPSARRREIEEAIEENMTLVVESARAIGCSVNDQTETNLIKGDPGTIRSFLIQLIRARVVNLPGMEDEPSTTFEDFTALMEKLGLGSREEQDGEEEIEEIKRQDETEKKVTWREHDSDALRQELTKKDREQHDTPPPAVRGTWKDERSKVTPDVDLSKPCLSAELSYEERAALRRLEREKKRKEREKLASGK